MCVQKIDLLGRYGLNFNMSELSPLKNPKITLVTGGFYFTSRNTTKHDVTEYIGLVKKIN